MRETTKITATMSIYSTRAADATATAFREMPCSVLPTALQGRAWYEHPHSADKDTEVTEVTPAAQGRGKAETQVYASGSHALPFPGLVIPL